MSTNLTFGIVGGVVGGLLVLIAVFLFSRTRSFVARAEAAKGTVTDMVYRRNSSDSTSGGYSAVYQFKTLDGQTIVKQDSLLSNPPRFKVGQEIDILYEPGNPNKASINTWMSLYFLPALLGGIGLIFGGVGIAIALPQVLARVGM
jgi:hypothetical protein